MKCLIFADPHWSSYSSIVRSRGYKYSTRLHNLIETMNWVEQTAIDNNCDNIICLGDFFDRAELNSEEITALQDILWSNIPHHFLVGNHEAGRGNLDFSSSHLFQLCENITVHNNIGLLTAYDTNVVLLPYVLECNRLPLKEYLKDIPKKPNTIILSHNDIAGVQMGRYLSKEGFSIEEIEENCTLFINGHLHNFSTVGNNIVNLGNITGQNFSEDGYAYPHQCMILDTVKREIEYIENPFALYFYKLDFTKYSDSDQDCKQMAEVLDLLKPTSVITVKVNNHIDSFIRDYLKTCNNIVESRLIIELNTSNEKEEIVEENLSINHLLKFEEYVKSHLGIDDLILQELSIIVGDVG